MMMLSSYFIFALLEGVLVLLPVIAGITLQLPHHSSSPPSPKPCPAKCTCNKTITDCSGLGLHQIPDALPSYTTALNVSHNRISHIDSRRLLHLSNLKELYLRENQVTFIPSDLWIKVPQLKILDLSSNFIACSCPLEKLEKHLNNYFHSSIHLINKNTTNCTRYLRQSDRRELPSSETCILKMRWKRKPSCATLLCRNGGTCVDNVRPVCECIPPYHGMYCELSQDDDKLPMDPGLSIQVISITSITIEISWSTPSDFDKTRYQISVEMEAPSISGTHRDPVTTTMRSWIIDGLQPSTSYRICIEQIYPEGGPHQCIIKTTQSSDTTPISMLTDEDWLDAKAQGNQPPYPQKPDLPRHTGDKGKEGQEMHYALISVAALFGVCLLLTLMLGFVYYKRVHGNIHEETGEPEQESENTTTDGGATRGRRIVLVSTGSELNADGGHVNATFDPDSPTMPQVNNGETSMRTKDGNSRKRSVRFDLSNRPESSQDATYVPDDNFDTVNTNVDDNSTAS